MALFQKADPTVAMLRTFDAAIAARVKLRSRLTDSEMAVEAATTSAQALALDGADDASLDKAQDILRAAQERTATFAGALAQSDTNIAQLESDIAVAIDQKVRTTTVAEIVKLQSDFETVLTDLATVLARVEPITERVSAFVPEATPLFVYAKSSRTQIPEALDLISRLLRDHSASVAAGNGPPTLTQPVVAQPKAALVAPPPAQIMFALRDVTWRDDSGAQQLGGKFADIYLPPRLVAWALKSGAAVKLDHELCKRNRGAPIKHPEPGHAFDLDAPRQIEPIKSSSPFQVIDRGPPRQIPLRVATRSEP